MEIDPTIYQTQTDSRDWHTMHPTWLATANEVSVGEFHVPYHLPNLLLLNDGSKKSCLSNICSHKKSLIMEGRGRLGSVITCPIHRWTWDLGGSIKGARGFQKDCKMDLTSYDLYEWNGHMFTGQTDWLADISELGDLSGWIDGNRYQWHSRSTISYGFDWKIFMEIFLDLYHVQSFHPGLSSLTDCKTFDWKFGRNWSCQTALFNKGIIRDQSYDELYRLYELTGHYDNAVYGAVWLGIYPNTMIEYYPGCLVVSTVWPNGPASCTNHLDFYYEKGLVDQHPLFSDIQQKCFMVTADEDEMIGLRMQKGLNQLTSPFVTMNHPVEEAGYRHFHQWLRNNLNP